MTERTESRKMRYDDSRRLEERINELKDLTFSPNGSELDKFKGLAPPGWTYALILDSIHGEPNTRLQNKMGDGWSPVPADRHPNICFNDTVDGRRVPNGYFSYKGVTLCERPTVICEKEEAVYNQKAMLHMNRIPDVDKYMGDPYIQGRFTMNPELSRRGIAMPYR